MRISLIVAMSDNGVIGRGGDLPWRLSSDLRRFKQLTTGHHIIMGRKTFESIGRLLPDRTSIVITRTPEYPAEGAIVVGDFDEAIRRISGDDEAFVIGGAEIYRLAIPRVGRLYVTAVHAEVDGDVSFPEINWDDWTLLEDIDFPADGANRYDYSFRMYGRVTRPPTENTETK